MAGQHIGRRGAFAEVMAQAGKAHGQRSLQARRHVQHHHGMHAAIDLWVVFGALRHAPESVEFGQQPDQRPAFAQDVEHARGPLLHQAAADFLPNALGNQGIDLAGRHHLAHELHGFGRDAEVGEARRKARQTQNAHRVFAKGIGHMAQHAVLQILLAVIGVHQVLKLVLASPVRRSGDGVDGEIAPRQVFFQCHIGGGVHHKAAIAHAVLALGARQRVFLMGLRVQEHRKVAPHGHEAARAHLLRCGSDHHPVRVVDGQAQQCIAHRAAYLENLEFTHAAMVVAARRPADTAIAGLLPQRCWR